MFLRRDSESDEKRTNVKCGENSTQFLLVVIASEIVLED